MESTSTTTNSAGTPAFTKVSRSTADKEYTSRKLEMRPGACPFPNLFFNPDHTACMSGLLDRPPRAWRSSEPTAPVSETKICADLKPAARPLGAAEEGAEVAGLRAII